MIRFQDQDSVGGTFHVDQAFFGSLDQLYILSKTLTESEITEIYQAGRKRLSEQITGGKL